MKILLLLAVILSPLPATVTFTMDDSHILYSPYNWSADATSARTINSGAYFRVIFSGTSISLTTDTSNMASPFSQLWIRVDSDPWVKTTLTAGNPTIAVASSLVSRKHLLQVVMKSSSYLLTRWQANSQTMVTITGIVADTAATLTAPVRKSKNVIIFGDSITEGAFVKGDSGASVPDLSDVFGDYSWASLESVDAEFCIVGFASQGIVATGAGSVPALPNSYNLIYTGVSRVFTPAPDLIIYNEGQNDPDTAAVTTDLAALLNAILIALPTTKQLVLSPFTQNRAARLSLAVTNVANALVTYQSTSGWWNSADSSDSVHPYDYSHMDLIAPKLIPVIQALLNGTNNRCLFPMI